MPTVLRYRQFRFFFYSNEGLPRDPPHIHIRDGSAEAKLWLRPTVRVAYNDGLSLRDLRELMAITEQKQDDFEKAWNEHFA